MDFGLCCKFEDQRIHFRTATAAHMKRLTAQQRLDKLALLCRENAGALHNALVYCHEHGIGAFRINSQILPLKTHGEVGYEVEDLPGGEEIAAAFRACGDAASLFGIRTSFHTDQFVVLSSPHPHVVEASIAELGYQAMVAGWVGADVINIHGGGAYGDKRTALERLAEVISGLNVAIRSRLTLENDDRIYTPRDLLPICRDVGIPLVYDVHHHRCNPDGLSIMEATQGALATWNRKPLFHISSPKEGWGGVGAFRHHDYVDPGDLPGAWIQMDITVDVEAKAKELAIAELQRALRGRVSCRNRAGKASVQVG
jgi:UV DNA damage endonuclease